MWFWTSWCGGCILVQTGSCRFVKHHRIEVLHGFLSFEHQFRNERISVSIELTEQAVAKHASFLFGPSSVDTFLCFQGPAFAPTNHSTSFQHAHQHPPVHPSTVRAARPAVEVHADRQSATCLVGIHRMVTERPWPARAVSVVQDDVECTFRHWQASRMCCLANNRKRPLLWETEAAASVHLRIRRRTWRTARATSSRRSRADGCSPTSTAETATTAARMAEHEHEHGHEHEA